MTTPEQRFAHALDSQFRHLGREALYRRYPDGTTHPIRVIARRPERAFELGDNRMHGEDAQLEFRVSEVASASRGDEIQIDDRTYRIESEPRLDLHQLVWVTETLRLADTL